MRKLRETEAFDRLRAMLEADPETVQVEGEPGVVRPLLSRVVALARGRGFLTGSVALEDAQRERRGPVDVDGLFHSWALQGAENSKLMDGLDAHRAQSPGVPALMVIDALDYRGTSHSVDVRTRLRALNNKIELLRLWIVLACDVNAPGDIAASDLASGHFMVTKS